MKKQIFFLLSLSIFSLCILSCESTRQTDITVNSGNSAVKNNDAAQTKLETGQGASADKMPNDEKTELPENKDGQQKMKSDSTDSASGDKFENRCGWFSNPTPANAWLEDKDGEWIIAVQGGYQAEGDWAEFSDAQWVKTNGNYGYGCTCMQVKVDRKNMRILEIASATAKPLSACRNDKALKEPKE